MPVVVYQTYTDHRDRLGHGEIDIITHALGALAVELSEPGPSDCVWIIAPEPEA